MCFLMYVTGAFYTPCGVCIPDLKYILIRIMISELDINR